MSIDEIKDDIFELWKTPTYLKAWVIVQWWQLSDKALDTLMDLSWLNAVQIDCKQWIRNLINCSLDRFTRLCYQPCILWKEAFLIFISGDRASCNGVYSVDNGVLCMVIVSLVVRGIIFREVFDLLTALWKYRIFGLLDKLGHIVDHRFK